MTEIWKDIPGYEGLYQVSNTGKVKSLSRDMPHKKYGTWHIKERILKPAWSGYARDHSDGYMFVFLHKGKGEQHIYRIHRLVADAFLPHAEGKTVVNHKDCDRSNNCVDNLEWVTDKENTQHAIKNGRCNNIGWPSRAVINLDTGEHFDSIKSACEVYGVTGRAIYQAAKNPDRRCCGYRWRYADTSEDMA